MYTFAALAAFLLSAWAPRPPHVAIKSIGIIAAVGDTCMFERVTDRPFEWIGPPGASFLEISDWNIDDDVTKTITAALESRYSVQAIAVEDQVFDTWTYDLLSRRVREMPVPETPVDAFLLVLRDWRADAIGGSVHQLGGLGLYRRDLPRGGKRVALFASYRLVLLEPEHGGILVSRAALLPDGSLPSLPVSSSLWPLTQNDLTDVQRDNLHRDFLQLLTQSLPATLQQMGLKIRSTREEFPVQKLLSSPRKWE